MSRTLIVIAALSLIAAGLVAAEPLAPIPPIARKLPQKGDAKAITDAERQQIEQQLEAIRKRLPAIARHPQRADVEIFTKAVDLALKYDEFYAKAGAKNAFTVLKAAGERLEAMSKKQTPWNTQRGNVVRGYVSSIDGSVQPYGLYISEKLDLKKPVPLYIWLHGRGDSATDLHFIAGRMGTKPGQIDTDKGIVLHPFGRQCIGWKSAGEIDIFEAIDDVAKHYKIDRDRIALMGFSMGGAGAWHVGAHYADRWAVIHAGAGFADVKQYRKLTPDNYPVWYEQALWGLYDVPEYRRNFLNTPTIAYSGEEDAQKATGDYMVSVINGEQKDYVPHIIGKKIGHKYTPEGLAEVMKFVDAALVKGREAAPKKVHLQTRTLRYSKMHWVEVLGLEQHWKDTRVEAELTSPRAVKVTTQNVAALSLAPSPQMNQVAIDIDGQTLKAPKAKKGQAVTLAKTGSKWAVVDALPTTLRKMPGLQGPMDDALYEPFLVVTPSGTSKSPRVQQWVEFELSHFQERWSSVYRGSLRMKKDTEVTADDIRQYHLICFGDADSNKLIADAAGKLPIRITGGKITAGKQTFDAASHVPLLTYPNPLNPKKYLVLNTGNTFRENHDSTNSLQNPKLPDWAIVDISTPPNGDAPGRIVAADFFDEQWQLKPRAVDPTTKKLPE